MSVALRALSTASFDDTSPPLSTSARGLSAYTLTAPLITEKMSWKLTKKLKETHLGFSRSSSQSTITPEAPQKSPATETPTNPSPLNPSSTNGSSASDPQGIAASEQMATATAAPAKPGILILTLHEGRGFSLPPGAEQAFAARPGHGGSISTGSFSTSYMGGNSARPGSSAAQGGFRPVSASGGGGGINNAPSTHGRYSSKYLPYALVDFDKQQIFVNSVSGTPENPIWAGESTQYKFDVSRSTELNLSLYIRNPSAAPNAGRQQDIFIGTCRVTPTFSEDAQSGAAQQPPSSSDGKNAKKDKMPPPSSSGGNVSGVQWHEVQYGTGSIRIGVKFVENR